VWLTVQPDTGRTAVKDGVTIDQWCQFQKDGYLRLGRVIEDDELAALQERIDDIMLGKAPCDYDRMLMQLDGGDGTYASLPPQTKGHKGPTLSYRKIQDLEYDDLFLRYMQSSLFGEICAFAYGRHASISCYRAMFMNKPARKGSILPWHQDGGDGWGLDRDPLVTVWTALDPAMKANGCVQVVPGSHLLGLLSDHGHTISAEHEAEHCLPDRIVYLELRPGEAVLLHNWLLHRSDVNRTDVPRRGFSVCYMDARTRHVQTGKGFPVVFGRNAMVPKPFREQVARLAV